MTQNRWRKHRPLFTSPVPRTLKSPQIKWRVWPIVWGAIKRTCTILGAFILLSSLIGVITATTMVGGTGASLQAPDEMVLYLKLDEPLQERALSGGFSDPFAFNRPTIHDYITAIDRAAADPRVHGILARLESESVAAPAQIQELRAALKRFRATGKFAHLYTPSFGTGMGGYYLASGFDQIWLQPMGVLSITGLRAEIPFFRGVLDKIGVDPQFLQRKSYKTAYESITNDNISPENREMVENLVQDMRDVMVSNIAQDRTITADTLAQHIDQGLFTAKDAAAAGLVTRADYVDILVGNITEAIKGEGIREGHLEMFIDVGRYLSLSKHKKTMAGTKPKVALVYATGTIMPTGKSGNVAAADEIAPAILEAADDPDIKAIVMRVDSPGGSPTASESILRAVQRAQEKGKPVIVSMATTAASGGYWISSSADQIFVSPTTITGSIGVVGGKVSLKEMWKKVGVNWAYVGWGDNAGLWSLNTPYTPAEKARVDNMLDQIYDGFVDRVARGRKLDPTRVEQIAQGRVWSGTKAVEIGLADTFGGLTDALNEAARMAGAQDRTGVEVIALPKPQSPWEQIITLFAEHGAVTAFKSVIAQMIGPFSGYLALSQTPEPYMAYDPVTVR